MLSLDERITLRTGLLLDACAASGIQPSGDLRVTEGEAARLLNVCVRTIQRAREDGQLEVTRIGRRVSYSLRALARYVELGTGAEAIPPPKRRRTRRTTRDDSRRLDATVKKSPRAHAESSTDGAIQA